MIDQMTKLSKVMSGCSEEDKLTMESWGQTLKESEIMLGLKDNDGIKMILKDANAIVESCKLRLANERDLTDEDRKLIFVRIDFYNWFMNLFETANKTKEYINTQIKDSIDKNTN